MYRTHVLWEVDSDGIGGVRGGAFLIHTLRITWTCLPNLLLAHIALDVCEPAAVSDVTDRSRSC